MALRGDRAADGTRYLRFHPPTLQLCTTPSGAPRHDASMGRLPGRPAHVWLDWRRGIAETVPIELVSLNRSLGPESPLVADPESIPEHKVAGGWRWARAVAE